MTMMQGRGDWGKKKIKFRGGILADDCNSYRYKGGAVGTTDVGVGIVKLPLPRIFFQKVLTYS